MGKSRWLVFANEKRVKHAASLDSDKKLISWVMGSNYHFNIGDSVYVFMSDERCVRYKTVVDAKNCQREDCDFWIETPPKDITYRLTRVKKYKGEKLYEDDLKLHGFKGGSSLRHPIKNNKDLLNYIESEFEKDK